MMEPTSSLIAAWRRKIQEARTRMKTGDWDDNLMEDLGTIAGQARDLRDMLDDIHDDASALFYEIEDTITGKEGRQ